MDKNDRIVIAGGSGLLASVRLADPGTGEPVAQPVVTYSYNFQGEVRSRRVARRVSRRR